MTTAPEKAWVSTGEVMRMARESGVPEDDAKKALINRLRSGLIRAVASKAIFRDGWAVKTEAKWDIPCEFWFSHNRDDLNEASWLTGDFVSTEYYSHHSGFQSSRTVTTTGVSLFLKDLEDLFSGQLRCRDADDYSRANSSRGAGRKPDMVSWTAFWMAVLQISQEGRLSHAHFQTQKALLDEILELTNGQPSETSIKPLVRQIWNRFVYSKDDG